MAQVVVAFSFHGATSPLGARSLPAPLLLHNRTRAADGGSPPSSPTCTRLLLLECLATAAAVAADGGADLYSRDRVGPTVRSAVRPFADLYSHSL